MRAVEPPFHRLRILFGTIYKEQLRLVNIIVDRIRALGGAGRFWRELSYNSPSSLMHHSVA